MLGLCRQEVLAVACAFCRGLVSELRDLGAEDWRQIQEVTGFRLWEASESDMRRVRFRHMKAQEQERVAPNKALQLTATSRSVYLCFGSYSAVVAVASRLPVAVAELGR